MLDRVDALSRLHPGLLVDLVFSHDAGGATPLSLALEARGLPANVVVDPGLALDGGYDLVHCIDFPEALERCRDAGLAHVVECHTAYRENRAYLRSLTGHPLKVVVPSALFWDEVQADLPAHARDKLALLRNFVPGNDGEPVRLPAWSGRPLLLFTRMDAHKNPQEFLQAMALLGTAAPGRFQAVLCGPVSDDLDLPSLIESEGLTGSVVCLPPVPFGASARFLRSMAARGAILVSPSRGESFGLSVAEAIGSGLPVVVSDIPAHRHLVGGAASMLYPLGRPQEMAERIQAVDLAYGEHVRQLPALAAAFGPGAFLEDWRRLVQACLPGGRPLF